MLERYWKPYFDSWTTGWGEWLEKVFRSPTALKSITQTLNTTFQGKQWTDKALYLAVRAAGLSSHQDQERILHQVTRFEGRLEDVESHLLEYWMTKDAAQQAQMNALLSRLEQVDEGQRALALKLEELSEKLATTAPSSETDELSQQLEQIAQKLETMSVSKSTPRNAKKK